MVTLFTTTKNFSGIFDVIQNNALKSWRSISTELQIIIIGNSEGSKEAADSINAEFVPEVRCSPEGTPILSDLFKIAKQKSKYNILVYANADIILPKDFLRCIHIVAKKFNRFLIVGHRWDMDVEQILDFDNKEATSNFWDMARKISQKHSCSGIDYFVFTKGQFNNIPNFVIGRWGWDNWLIWKARRSMLPIIDASDDIQVIHQNHSYKFHNIRSKDNSMSGDEFKNNYKLCYNKSLNILDATYKIIDGGIIKNNSKAFINRNLGKLPKIFPEFSLPLIVYKKIYRKYFL